MTGSKPKCWNDLFEAPISDEESKKRHEQKLAICKKIYDMEEIDFDELNDFFIK